MKIFRKKVNLKVTKDMHVVISAEAYNTLVESTNDKELNQSKKRRTMKETFDNYIKYYQTHKKGN